jgi:hypothetical protein
MFIRRNEIILISVGRVMFKQPIVWVKHCFTREFHFCHWIRTEICIHKKGVCKGDVHEHLVDMRISSLPSNCASRDCHRFINKLSIAQNVQQMYSPFSVTLDFSFVTAFKACRLFACTCRIFFIRYEQQENTLFTASPYIVTSASSVTIVTIGLLNAVLQVTSVVVLHFKHCV